MAVIPTGAIYKALIFDGESSRNYGVYITGEAVYNSPERDVEMIKIPGRNGEFALDNGRFQNIEVTYPAGIFADSETDFAAAISDFRNFLASRVGYCRLEDEYNPNEYRMAVYKSGLNVDPAKLEAGEFDITFDCKPQRWLKDGETAVTIGEWGETETASGDIVTVENPNGILAVKSLEVDLEPIQSGSGTPSPTNVRPISGHDSVDVTRTGKNLCDTSLVYNGYINVSQRKIVSNANARTLYLPCKPNTTYTVSKQAGQRFVVAESTVIPTNNVVVSNVVSDYTASSITITTTASAKYLVAFVYLSTADTSVTADQMLATCQIELGSTATAYEPYQGDTYTTALGRTVYGGTLDVVSGDFVVTNGYIASYNGETLPSTWISDRDAYASGTTPTTGAQVVYKLATPQTYQLTAQQISLLTGDNNIWSSGGDITLEYGQNPSVLFNPTLFESSPLLETAGSGSIQFNGYEIGFEGVPIGEVVVCPDAYTSSSSNPATLSVPLDTSLLNAGDLIYPATKGFRISAQFAVSNVRYKFTSASVTSTTNVLDASANINANKIGLYCYLWPDFGNGFAYGIAENITCSATYNYAIDSGAVCTEQIQVTIAYDGADTITVTVSRTGTVDSKAQRSFNGINQAVIYGDSSKPNNDPIFIDCDLGEAYTNEGGVYRSLNQYIDLGSELPTLGVGANEVTFDNTITELEVTPRWWKV